ncbi:MAG: hypothetical protein O3A00_24385 [Planctomycetota bacterium]|nr:hypothetical protein [Planctomycetota bacterium]
MTALATAKLKAGQLDDADKLISKLDLPSLRQPIRAFQTQIAGMREDFDQAAKHFRELQAPMSLAATLLFDELKHQFVDRRGRRRSIDWLCDQQLVFQTESMQSAA